MSWLRRPRRLLGLDTETTGLGFSDRVRLVQFGDADEAWAIPVSEWKALIRHALEEYDGAVAGQNLKFDDVKLRASGLPGVKWDKAHDTKPMLHLNNSLGPQSLKPAAAHHLGGWAAVSQAALKKAMTKNRWDWATVPVDFPPYWAYACMDTILTVRLAEKLWPRVQHARRAYDLEMAVQRILADVETTGVRLNVEYADRARADISERVARRRDKLPVNPGSPSQIVKALQEDGVTLRKRTKSGGLSVDDSVLSALDHPLARQVTAYRADKKTLGYFESFLKHEVDGRLHPHINQLAAVTGRMSIVDPALQTLPRTKEVRSAILPDDEDHVLILADYDTQELRTAAHLSRDEALINALLAGEDVHMITAQAAFGPDATKAQRSIAKNGIYSWSYGAKLRTFAETIGTDTSTAQRVLDGLVMAYPGMAKLMADVMEAVEKRADGGDFGWIHLPIDGRRLYVPAHKAYKALNYLIQGLCAYFLKQAILDLAAAGLAPYIRLPVHDELVFSVPRDIVEDVIPAIVECMERHDLRVPLTVGTKVVDTWGDPYD